jgi:hypothetical protein
LRFLEKFFEKNLLWADSSRVYGGRSEINIETDRTVHSSGGPGERFAAYPRMVREALAEVAGSWRTVRPTQQATLTIVDFIFLLLKFKRGLFVRASQTVHEVRVFDIMASNFERFILHCGALPLLYLTHFP